MRLIVPWDIASTGKQEFDAHAGSRYARLYSETVDWFDAINRMSSVPEILVSFEKRAGVDADPATRGDQDSYMPGKATYKDAVGKFMDQFPQVRWYTAWNEPNHPDQPTSTDQAPPDDPGTTINENLQGARQAARYFKYVAELCRDRGTCSVAAGDFLDRYYTKAYIQEYWDYLVRRPHVWAWHAYGSYRLPGATKIGRTYFDRFLKFTSSSGGADSKVWLSEQGAITDAPISPHKDENQTDQGLVNLLTVADMSPRITRFYYHQWKGNQYWDSGLMSYTQQDPDDPGRPEQRLLYDRFKNAVG